MGFYCKCSYFYIPTSLKTSANECEVQLFLQFHDAHSLCKTGILPNTLRNLSVVDSSTVLFACTDFVQEICKSVVDGS